MKSYQLKRPACLRIGKGFPLVMKEDFIKDIQPADFSDAWVQFTNEQGKYVATGYLGKQNKGYGWILTRDSQAEIQGAFFLDKFTQAKLQRQTLFSQTDTTAFRVFNGEGDGLGGLIVDYYQGFLVLSWYNETLYKHQAEIVEALKNVFPEVLGGYEKIRFDAKNLPESRLAWGQEAPSPLLITENGITYATYLDEGLMTGIFLDQREVRGLLASGMASGKSVLNTFSYTGAFSVAAALGGAETTTSVDLAKRSLTKTQEQFAVNHLPAENQQIYVMDVFDFFKYALRKGLRYDLIVLDPPSFARNKKRTFSVAKNYDQLVADILPLLNPGGYLVASTNAANVPKEKFQKLVETSLANSQRSYRLLVEKSLPADFKTLPQFPEGAYLKVLVYEVQ